MGAPALALGITTEPSIAIGISIGGAEGDSVIEINFGGFGLVLHHVKPASVVVGAAIPGIKTEGCTEVRDRDLRLCGLLGSWQRPRPLVQRNAPIRPDFRLCCRRVSQCQGLIKGGQGLLSLTQKAER